MEPMTLPTLPSSPPPATVKDLVCGMNVGPTKTKHSVVHEGKDYFFCSAGCLEKLRPAPMIALLLGGCGRRGLPLWETHLERSRHA